MSNLITQNPLILDTAGTSVLTSMILYITNIRWVDYNNDVVENDQVVLKDASGKVFFEDRATGIGTVADLFGPVKGENFIPAFRVTGLICDTLSHGKVYIYCDQARQKIPLT